MFSEERFINEVFDSCCAVTSTGSEFKADSVISKTYEAVATGEEGYWQRKNVIESLSIIEGMKLISSRIQPEYTKNVRFLKEVRYDKITTLGQIFSYLPDFIKCSAFFACRRQRRILSTLGFLSFIYLCHRAYMGVAIISGWLEYGALLILLYLAFLSFNRLIH